MSAHPATGDVAHADVEIRFAEPGDAEGIAALYDSVYEGRFPILDCVEPERIRRLLQSGEHIWVIGVVDGTVVGSSVGTADPANSAYELGRAAMLNNYSGRGHFLKVFAYSVTAAQQRLDRDLVYGYARSERARMLFSYVADQAEAPVTWVGTDGGMHPNGDIREEHLIGVTFLEARNAIRVLPPRPFLDPASSLARQITELKVRTVAGQYPDDAAAGHGGQYVRDSVHGEVAYSLFEPSRAAIVAAVTGPSPASIRRALWDVFDGANDPDVPPRILHMSIYVLADKVELIEELCSPHNDNPGQGHGRRFTVNGYLPGWHKSGTARYDCVLLTARIDDLPRSLLGTDATAHTIWQSLPAHLRD